MPNQTNLPGQQVLPGYGAYGGVPSVPNPFGTQGGAISGNMGNLGSLYGLTNSFNTSAAQQGALPFQLNLPNYNAMTSASSQNILSKLKGQVPTDVANQIAQMAAERGASSSGIQSPNSNAALLAVLGKTSWGAQNEGEQQFTGAMARTPQGHQFDPNSFLVGPGQFQDAQFGANTMAAAPNPRMAAQAALRAAHSGLNSGSGFWGNHQSSAPSSSIFGGSGNGGWPGSNGGSALFPTQAPSPQQTQNSWNSWNQGMPWNQPTNSNPFQQGDFESMGFEDDQSPQWQTGMPLNNYQGSQWNDNMFADLN